MDVITSIRRFLTRPHVRPWALSAPILVLMVCLPLLRPVRHPDPRQISDDELARLATIESLVRDRSLAIETSSFMPTAGTIHRNGHVFSQQPPTMSVLLAGPYWVMQRLGVSLEKNPTLVAYLLTLIGVTAPVAMAAGLIYRMARMFELPRRVRAALSALVVFGSGLVAYGVVLNAHAPAATLLLAAAACIIHVAISKQPGATSGWLAIAGLCAALAAAIDPAAAVFVLLFAFAIPVMRWRWRLRFGGLLLYCLGAAPPLLLHFALMHPITGEWAPPMYQRSIATASSSTSDEIEDFNLPATWWNELGKNLARLTSAMLGAHGVFSHFPVLLLGLFGIAAVMHRHWPATTKALAVATVGGAIAVMIALCVVSLVGPGKMYGPQSFIVFLPLLLFWSGAWMRRKHHAIKWAMAGVLILFSIAVTLIGATYPFPRHGFGQYTVAGAVDQLIHPPPSSDRPVLAGR
jgi:hypothetical protein